MRRATLPGVAAILSLFLLNACAPTAPPDSSRPNGPVTLAVQLTNECTETVDVFFVSEAGLRVRVGSVGPLQSGVFSPRLAALQPGHFITRRLGSVEQPNTLLGEAEPAMMRRHIVLITIGQSPEFDRWTMGR